MNKHIMETNSTFTVSQEEEVADFKCNVKDWHYLESSADQSCSTKSFFKWVYALPSDQFLSRAIIIIGKWTPHGDQKNRFFVRGSKNTQSEDLQKLQTFKATQDAVNKIAESANKYFEKNNWETVYPEVVRYGIRPTEAEIEVMDKEDLAKYPRVIKQP